MDLDARRAVAMPAWLRAAIESRLAEWDRPPDEARSAPRDESGFIDAGRDTVRPWEIDVLGHMSVSFYLHRYSDANMHVVARFGMTPAYLRKNRIGFSTFEFQGRFRRELRAGDRILIRSGLMHVGGSSMRIAAPDVQRANGRARRPSSASTGSTSTSTRGARAGYRRRCGRARPRSCARAGSRGHERSGGGDGSPLFIEQIEIGPMKNFTYVVGSETTREVALVDPAWDIDGLLEHVEKQDLKPVAALDHPLPPGPLRGRDARAPHRRAWPSFSGKRGVKVYVHREEADGLRRVTGLEESDLVRVDSGDRMSVGEIEVEFLHTPGHTPGSQCFRIRNTLVSGDTLFIQGCGRVDLPGSDPDSMYESLKRLASLPDETILLPGHNYSDVPRATLGETKQGNFYLRVPDLETWRRYMGDSPIE